MQPARRVPGVVATLALIASVLGSVLVAGAAHGAAGNAASLTVTGAPPSITAGTPFSITVMVKDAIGNPAIGFTDTVHFSSTDAGAILPPNYKFTVSDAGTHTFHNGATLNTAGPQTITATDTTAAGLTDSTDPILVTPNPPTHFGVVAPSTATAGTPVSVTVTALDSNEKTSTGYRGTAHFTSSDSAAVLPADYTFTAADSGHHTFSVTFKTAGMQTVTATDATAVITGTSNQVTVTGAGPTPDPVTRLAGDDRILTAIAASKDSFPNGGAGAVVLARSDGFADALGGTPLAVAKGGPLLLTAPGNGLDSRVSAEISRALPKGRVVYILGGPGAVDSSVDDGLVSLGYQVVRLQGGDRYATAVAVAHDGLGDPGTQFLATGNDFADALAGGAAAANVTGGAAILLTNGSTMAPATGAYLNAHPTPARFALGGPAAAAAPTAVAIVGTDRFDTAVKVAQRFFSGPPTVGVAYGFNFPDALAGGAHIGAKHSPLLLVNTGSIPTVVGNYLTANKSSIASGFVYGGTSVVSEGVRSGVRTAIT